MNIYRLVLIFLSKFCRNSEAFALGFLENLKELFP